MRLGMTFTFVGTVLLLVGAGSTTAQLSSASFSVPVGKLVGGGGSSTSPGNRITGSIAAGPVGASSTGGTRVLSGFVPLALAGARSIAVFPVSTAPAAADAALRVEFVPDFAAVSATLNYRAGGDASFTAVAMTETSPGSRVWTAPVPGASLGVRGLQYYVEADEGAGPTNFPPGAAAAGTASLGVQVSGVAAFSLGATTYALAGASLSANNTDPAAVFSSLGSYNRGVWRYGTFDPASGRYRELDESPRAASAVPGQGFWVVSKNGASVPMSGQSTDLSAPLTITLQPGWNQIAHPFAFPVDFADVGRPAGVSADLVDYDGSGYRRGRTRLEAFRGYWIENQNPAAAVITVPPLGAGVAPAAARAPGTLDPRERGWSVAVRAQVGRFHDGDHRFGARNGSSERADAFDLADVPAPPAGYVDVAFVSDEGDRFFADYRPLAVPGAVWTLALNSDQTAEPFRVDFAREGEWPADWLLRAITARGAEEVDLLVTPALGGRLSAPGERTWTVVAGPESFVDDVREEILSRITELSLGAAFPNPARLSSGVSLQLESPRDTRASLRVYDVGGRLVQTLLDGSLARGAHRIRWDGSDRAGRRVAAGVYFARLQTAEGKERSRKLVFIE